MALGLTTPATATTLTSSQSAATDSLSAEPVTTLSAPSALNVYRDASDTGETYSMSARAPLFGGTDISGIYFVLKDRPGTEVDNSWVGRGSEDTSVYSTSMYVDHASVVALAKHDLVMQAFAYRGTDSGSMVVSATPARAMIYAKNRAQIQWVNRVRHVEQGRRFIGLDMEYPELQRRRTSRDLQHLGCNGFYSRRSAPTTIHLHRRPEPTRWYSRRPMRNASTARSRSFLA